MASDKRRRKPNRQRNHPRTPQQGERKQGERKRRKTNAATACFAQPRPVIPLLDYQKADVESNDRFRWNCWARQTGKSFTKALRRILRGLRRKRNQIFLSAGERQCAALMRKAREHCQALQIASRCTTRKSDQSFNFRARQMELELPGGVRIIGLPANPATARGYTGDVLLDEFAMHKDDREIWSAMFPTLLRGGGELDMASTPKGKGTVFHETQFNEDFGVSYVTLPQAVEAGLNVNTEEIRKAMGDESRFRQEFLCEFLDSEEAFLDYDRLLACVSTDLKLVEHAAELHGETTDLVAGVDLARHRDLTVMWVARIRRDRLQTAAILELRQQTFAKQYEHLRTLINAPTMKRCCIDATGLGMPFAERALEEFGSHRVEPITFTAAAKAEIAQQLRCRIEEQKLDIPDDERVIKDLHAVRRIVTATGHVRLDADRNNESHADRFWAAALAVHAGENPQGPAEAMVGASLHFSRKGTW